jgi:hypothetical protein
MKKKGNQFRPGVSAKNGKLYVFSETRIIVIKGWPEMAAWTKTIAHPAWKRIRPVIAFEEGYVESKSSRHRSAAGRLPGTDYAPVVMPTPEDALEALMEEELDEDEVAPVAQEPDEARLAEIRERERVRMEAQKKMVTEYFGNVPAEVCSAVLPFVNRQWHLLAMAARVPESVELLRELPSLGYALASNWIFRAKPSREGIRFARKVVSERRRTMAHRLGFPETEGAVRILKKVRHSACRIPMLLSLRRMMEDPEQRKLLNHLPSISCAVMVAMGKSHFRRMFSPAFIQELARDPEDDARGLVSFTFDTMRMAKILMLPPREGLRSMEELTVYHDELVDRMNRDKAKTVKELVFPPSPLPGSEDIIPLDHPKLLVEEARAQRNCILSYASSVVAGEIHFYRVLQPERATMAIYKKGPLWSLKEIQGPCNRPVSPDTVRQVQEWIAREQLADTPF